MALDSNETNCEMEDAISSQDHERLQPVVDTAMASAKQEVKADTKRFTCECREVFQVVQDMDEDEGAAIKRCKVLRTAAKVELAKVYKKLFVVQKRMEKEVGQSSMSSRERERSLKLRADSLLFKVKVQKKAAKIIELSQEVFPDTDEQVEAGDSQVVESLRLQVARLEREEEEMTKEVDSLCLQLKGGKKVIENLHILHAGLQRQMKERGVPVQLVL